MFTHGGLITAYMRLVDQDIDSMPPNCSVIGVSLKDDHSGQPLRIDIRWDFPYLEEDI